MLKHPLFVMLVFTASAIADEPQVHDGLGELNAARAQRGLRPFALCDGLARAAASCAKLRAERLIHGHLPGRLGDFAYLPAGTHADAAGCGALEPSWGWQSCCAWDSYRYAGAAWVMGRDGRRYMHVFVSNTVQGPAPPQAPAVKTNEPLLRASITVYAAQGGARQKVADGVDQATYLVETFGYTRAQLKGLTADELSLFHGWIVESIKKHGRDWHDAAPVSNPVSPVSRTYNRSSRGIRLGGGC